MLKGALIGVLNGSCSEPMADNKSYCWAKAWCPVERENKTIRYDNFEGFKMIIQMMYINIMDFDKY